MLVERVSSAYSMAKSFAAKNADSVVDGLSAIIASQNAVAATASTAIQYTNLTRSYEQGMIVDEHGNKDHEEYQRLQLKTSSVPVSSFVFGSAAKALCAVTGLGWFAIPAAVGYGLLGALLTRKAFDRYIPESKQKRRELKLAAIGAFHFFEADLENKEVFNKAAIEKRYKKLAKIYHPDRKYGDRGKFEKLEVYHRVVLALLNDDSVFPMPDFHENDSNVDPKPICLYNDELI